MIIAITILSVLLVVTMLFVTACITHILKIQKELDLISHEQSRQNEDINNLMTSQMEVIKVLQYAASLETKITSSPLPWSNIKGEA
jgi:hypothetical protein